MSLSIITSISVPFAPPIHGQPGARLTKETPKYRSAGRTASRVDRRELPDRYVCIHTTSEDGLKDWQPTQWNRLIDHINGVHGLCVVELGLRSLLGL